MNNFLLKHCVSCQFHCLISILHVLIYLLQNDHVEQEHPSGASISTARNSSLHRTSNAEFASHNIETEKKIQICLFDALFADNCTLSCSDGHGKAEKDLHSMENPSTDVATAYSKDASSAEVPYTAVQALSHSLQVPLTASYSVQCADTNVTEREKSVVDNPLAGTAAACVEDLSLGFFGTCADIFVPVTHTETPFTAVQATHTEIAFTDFVPVQCIESCVPEKETHTMDNLLARAAAAFVEDLTFGSFGVCTDIPVAVTHTETPSTAVQATHADLALTTSYPSQFAENFVDERAKSVADNSLVRAATTSEEDCPEFFGACADTSVPVTSAETPDVTRPTQVILQTPLCLFLSGPELCAASLTHARGFVQIHGIVLLRRHLLLVGGPLLEVGVAPTVALAFEKATQASSYVCLSCQSRFNLMISAAQCDCREKARSNRCKLALAETFNYVFSQRSLSTPTDFAFLSLKDLGSLSLASSFSFVSTQPSLRLRLLSSKAGRQERDKATVSGNVDVIKLDNGAVYQCNLCQSLYSALIACSVCECMICAECGRVRPVHVEYFNNPGHLCNCPS